MPNSNLPIYQTPLDKLQEWAHDSEKRLAILSAVTNETIKPPKKGGPQNYSQLISDLKNAETVRRKEAEILGERSLLQTRYGARFFRPKHELGTSIICSSMDKENSSLFWFVTDSGVVRQHCFAWSGKCPI